MTTTQANILPAYALIGSTRLLRADALNRILTSAMDQDRSSTVTKFDGAETELADVLDEVRTPSLLAGRRLVVVDNADSFVSAHRQALERYGASPAEDGTLILLCNSMPKTTRLYKIIHKIGETIPCDPPKGRAVIGWLTGRANTHHQKKLTGPAAHALRDQLGDDLGLLDAELSKLAAYVGSRTEITDVDVRTLTGSLREEKVFGLADAMARGDVETALGLWKQVLATDRAAPGRAIAGLAWGVRQLRQARYELDHGGNLYAISRKLYTDPSTAKRRLDRWSVDELEAQQSDLLRADLAMKTGASTIETAVEKYILVHSLRN